MQDLLTNEVDRIAVVSAPAVDDEALQLRITDFLSDGGDVGLDVQHDEVIAEAVGEALLQNRCGIQSGGGTSDDVVSSVDGEGDADGAQLVHGLLLQVSNVAVVRTQADHGLAVVSLAVEAHLLGHQGGVLLALGVIADTRHGVVVVLALQGVDLVGTGIVVGQIQALVEALTEGSVGNCLVPVVVGGAVLVVLLVVEVHLVAELLGTLLTQLSIVLAVGISLDGGQGALAHIHLVQLTVLVQLESNGAVADHGDGEAVEAGYIVCTKVVGVGDVALGVLADELLHHIGTIVPHVGVIAGTEALNAQLVDQILRGGVEAGVGSNGIEVGAGILAGEDQGVVVRSLNAHACIQHILVGQLGSSVAHIAGLLIVISSTGQGLVGHGGVVGLVLGCVQHPLQTHEEVLAGQVSLDLAVHIHPVHIVAEVEGPNGRVLIVAPLLGHGRHGLAVAVKAQQAFPQVGGNIHVGSHLAVQHVPALQLTVGALPGDELLQRGSASGVGSAGSTRGSGGGAAARVAAAGGQNAGGTNDTGSLQKAAAADCMRLVVVVHCVFLPIIIPCFSAWCRAGCPAVFPLFCGGFLNPVLPGNTKERRNRPLCLHLCSSRKTLTRHILYH